MKTSSEKIRMWFLVICALLTLFFLRDKIFDFKIRAEVTIQALSYRLQDQFAQVLYANEHIKLPIVFRKQQHALSCETAALAMALNYKGAGVTENELLAQLTFDMKGPKVKGVWGDPENGFVGDVDGSIFYGTGYGVYDEPIKDVAFIYRDAFSLHEPDLWTVLEQVNSGNPVIVWGLISDTKPVYWKTKDGRDITGYPGEHARIVIGWAGDITDPTTIVLMDPIYGKIRVSTDKFLAGWEKLDNRAVVIF